MSEIVLYQLVLQKLGKLSPQHLVELNAFLGGLLQKQNHSSQVEPIENEQNDQPIAEYKTPKFGFGKFKVEIADDFDAPLEDFKDYM